MGLLFQMHRCISRGYVALWIKLFAWSQMWLSKNLRSQDTPFQKAYMGLTKKYSKVPLFGLGLGQGMWQPFLASGVWEIGASCIHHGPCCAMFHLLCLCQERADYLDKRKDLASSYRDELATLKGSQQEVGG